MKVILVPIDFSDVTEAVITAAGELAWGFDSQVWLLHVAEPDPDFVGYDAGPQTVRDQIARHLHKEKESLEEIETRLRENGVNATALIIQGPTVEKILAEADRLGAEAIIMGSHGHGALRRLLVGSVTDGVIRGADCPVLVVPFAQDRLRED